MTYQKADEFLLKGRSKNRRPLTGRSSEMVRRDNGIAIKYHATDVVTLHADETATLNSGGYRTPTTKGRINEYTRARLGQTRGLWYMGDGSLFYDGMKIGPDGQPIKPLKPEKTEKKKRQLDRLVSNYLRAFKNQIARDKSLPKPNGGDCWYCHLTTEDNKSLGEATGNADHILQHLKDRYVMGSILWRSMQRRGNPAVCWAMAQSSAERNGDSRMALDDLRYYLRTLKPALLELM